MEVKDGGGRGGDDDDVEQGMDWVCRIREREDSRALPGSWVFAI